MFNYYHVTNEGQGYQARRQFNGRKKILIWNFSQSVIQQTLHWSLLLNVKTSKSCTAFLLKLGGKNNFACAECETTREKKPVGKKSTGEKNGKFWNGTDQFSVTWTKFKMICNTNVWLATTFSALGNHVDKDSMVVSARNASNETTTISVNLE